MRNPSAEESQTTSGPAEEEPGAFELGNREGKEKFGERTEACKEALRPVLGLQAGHGAAERCCHFTLSSTFIFHENNI